MNRKERLKYLLKKKVEDSKIARDVLSENLKEFDWFSRAEEGNSFIKIVVSDKEKASFFCSRIYKYSSGE